MTQKDVLSYATANTKAMQMIQQAVDDYAAARCLLLNGLFPGLVLGAQAVEKYLKGSVLFLDDTKNTRTFSHGIRGIKDELINLSGLRLDEFDPFLERLEKHYLTRYPDNENRSKFMSTDELHELDELIIFINENLSIPKEVKFRSGLYSQIFKSNSTSPEGDWLLRSNLSLDKIYDRLSDEYKEVEKHLYP